MQILKLRKKQTKKKQTNKQKTNNNSKLQLDKTIHVQMYRVKYVDNLSMDIAPQ